MSIESNKTESRLIIQGSIPVDDFFTGDIIYKQLKEIFAGFDASSTLNGQIVKMCEPCCSKKKEGENVR